MRFLIALWLILSFALENSAAEDFRRDTVLMGVSINIGVVAEDSKTAHSIISEGFAEINRIEQLISSWNPNSQTSLINSQAGIKPVVVDAELFELIRRSKKISQLSNGYFDISFSSIHNVWDFEQFEQTSIPSEADLKKSVALIDYSKIILDEIQKTVFLEEKGMRIGFGAMGKGYAANRVRELFLSKGVRNGIVNAGGDLISWGTKADGTPYRVGITNPFNVKTTIGAMDAKEMAVVTSGNYERFIEIDGKKYCHIIDPKTGWPVENLASVTVISPDAEFADALATTVFVLGKDEGLKLVNHLEGVECLIVDSKGKRYLSQNLEAKYWIDEKKN